MLTLNVKMLRAFLPLLLISLPNQGAYAAEACARSALRTAPVGFECSTSTGHLFKLMHRSGKGKEFWLDRESGLIWGDKLTERIRRKVASELCRKKTEGETSFGNTPPAYLPSLADFETSEKRGFREVLPNMNGHFYWINSSVPGAANIGQVFNGSLGKSETVVYRSINFENIRCVLRK